MLSIVRTILTTATLFLLFACGGGGGGGSSDSGDTATPTNVIRINETIIRTLSPGDSFAYDFEGTYESYDWDGTISSSSDIDTTIEQTFFSTSLIVNSFPILSIQTSFGTGESSISLVLQDSEGSWGDYVEDTENGYVYFYDSSDSPGILVFPSPLIAGGSYVFQFTQKAPDGKIMYTGNRTITVGNIEQVSTAVGLIEAFPVKIIEGVEQAGFLPTDKTSSDYTYWIHPSIGIVRIFGVDNTFFSGNSDLIVSSTKGTATLRSTNVPMP